MNDSEPYLTNIAALTALDCPVIRKYTLDTEAKESDGLEKIFIEVQLSEDGILKTRAKSTSFADQVESLVKVYVSYSGGSDDSNSVVVNVKLLMIESEAAEHVIDLGTQALNNAG